MLLAPIVWVLTIAIVYFFVAQTWWFPPPINDHARAFDAQFLRTLIVVGILFFVAQFALGWAIFRCEHSANIIPFLGELFRFEPAAAVLEIPPEVPLALLIGAFISLSPTLPFYPRLVEGFRHQAWLRWPAVSTLMVIYVLALARAFALPFQPFIYFRF